MSQSNNQFTRTLEVRHNEVRLLARAYVKNCANHSRDQNAQAAAEFLAACKHLDAILAPPDKPAWITTGIPVATSFAHQKQVAQASAFSKWLHENGKAIESPIVPLTGDDVPFDKIYGDIRDANGIPELFDQMIDSIGRIISLNVIDSSAVKDSLGKLRAVLESNRKGSQGAIFATMDYGNFVRLMLKGYGKKFFGPAFEAFDKTYGEAKTKVKQVDLEYRRVALEKLVDKYSLLRFIQSGVVDTVELTSSVPAGFIEAPIESAVTTDDVEESSLAVEIAK